MSNSFSSLGSPRDVARILFRHRRKGAAFFCGAMLLTVIGLIVCPRTYTSEARLFVRLGRENVTLDPTATTGQVVNLHASRENEMNSVIEVLRSRSNLEYVLDKLDPAAKQLNAQERDKKLRKLQKDVEVFAPRNSTVVIVTGEAKTPERAQQIVAGLVEAYGVEHLRIHRTPGSYQFFDEQATLLKKQLDGAEAELRDAKKRLGLVSLQERRTALQQQISHVEKQFQENGAALAASDAKIESMQSRLDRLPDLLVQQLVSGTPSQGLSGMRQKLYELETREQELLAKFQPIHPDVIAIREQVREAKAILAAETPLHGDAAIAVLAAEESLADSLHAQAETLAVQLDDLRREQEEFNEHELLVSQMERKVTVLDASYTAYVKDLELARIDEALKREGITNIAVAQPATFSPKPTSPRKGLAVAAALVLATIGSLGVMFLADFLDPTLKTPEEVEARLGLPVLATVSHVRQGLLVSH
ncbi:MAG: hypothetical protein KY475_17380 [Planctomycetes bacterium]|nr:hypothetical protein [Planctomycetota bacterium]